jgi:hypothetical protein
MTAGAELLGRRHAHAPQHELGCSRLLEGTGAQNIPVGLSVRNSYERMGAKFLHPATRWNFLPKAVEYTYPRQNCSCMLARSHRTGLYVTAVLLRSIMFIAYTSRDL